MRYPIQSSKLTPKDLAKVAKIVGAKLDAIILELTDPEWVNGMTWYAQANTWSRDVATRHSMDTHRVAWAIALTSPLNNWEQNKLDVLDLLATGECGALPLGATRAMGVLFDGELGLDVAGGRKVRSFGRNITHPHNSLDVTLDSHMANILDLPPRYLERKGVYDTIADTFRTRAELLGVLPHQLQAAVWLHQRAT